MNVLRQLPNALTLCNLLMGTLAVFLLGRTEFHVVLLLMGGCLLADILDGALARKMGVAGELGIQLDSLADVVSFGVLPALIMHHLALRENLVGGPGFLSMFFPALIAVSAGLRLARFNVDERPREFFWGLATPAGGILVASLGWAILRDDSGVFPEWRKWVITIGIPVFLVIMYQAALKLPGLKSPRPALITLGLVGVFMLVGLILWGPIAIAMGIVLYVLLGLLNLIVKWY